MNCKQQISAALFLTLLTTTTAWAGATSGSFLGLKVGASRLSLPNSNLPNSSNASFQRAGLAWGAVGGYNYALSPNRLIGIEMNFNDYAKAKYKGTVSGTSYKAEVNQYDVDMLLDLGLVSDAGINGTVKFGLARVSQRTTGINGLSTDTFTRGENTLTRYRPKAELQLGFMPDTQWNIAVIWSHLFGKSASSYAIDNKKTISNDSVMLSLQYTIPQ